MWKKIQDNNDVEKIKEGLILIKYPIQGDVTDTLSISDSGNLLRYEVFKVHPAANLVELIIPEADILNPAVILGVGQITGLSDNPPVLNKNISDFVDDGKWWYEA